MADSTLWWLATGCLVGVELISGTFYLLMVAVGLAAAALAAHAGLPVPWQWVSAAVVGGGSVLAWHRYRLSKPSAKTAQANSDVNLDVGETVHVDAWQPDHTTKVKYRGAQWDASLQANEDATAGAYVIVQVIGSRLILARP